MLTHDQVLDLFSYDSETGELRWRVPKKRVRIGSTVGGKPWIYLRTTIGGHRYYVHKLVWQFHTGEYPAGQLDHRNRNKLDNRIENLRKATDAQNKQNVGLISRNTSGAKGISLDRKRGTYRVTYTDRNHRPVFVGRFPCLATAMIARAFAVIGEHGEFAT